LSDFDVPIVFDAIDHKGKAGFMGITPDFTRLLRVGQTVGVRGHGGFRLVSRDFSLISAS
jgi:hypothetical protein